MWCWVAAGFVAGVAVGAVFGAVVTVAVVPPPTPDPLAVIAAFVWYHAFLLRRPPLPDGRNLDDVD